MMIAFSFAHFRVGTALRSFTSFSFFFFFPSLISSSAEHSCAHWRVAGTVLHILLVSNKMRFFQVCVGMSEKYRTKSLRFLSVRACVEFGGCFVLTMFAPNFPALGSNNLCCRLFRTGLKFLFFCCCPF